MQIQIKDLSPIFLIVIVLLLVSSMTTGAVAPQEKQFPRNDDRPSRDRKTNANENKIRESIEKSNQASLSTVESQAQAVMLRARTALLSEFTESSNEFLGPQKAVLSCDAVSLLNQFTLDAASKAADSVFISTRHGIDEKLMSTAEANFKQFLKEQQKHGESLKNGKMLITGESFNTTKARICPLIPIC